MGEALLIFKSITKLTEVEDILRKLLSSHQPLHFQGTADPGFSLSPQALGANMDLQCTFPDGLNLPEGTFSTSFHLNDEKYILERCGYSIAGKSAIFISKIDGDYYNILGMPISRVYKELKKLGYKISDFK